LRRELCPGRHAVGDRPDCLIELVEGHFGSPLPDLGADCHDERNWQIVCVDADAAASRLLDRRAGGIIGQRVGRRIGLPGL
jgi:hypothetical protein